MASKIHESKSIYIFSAIIYFEKKIYLLICYRKNLTNYNLLTKNVYSTCAVPNLHLRLRDQYQLGNNLPALVNRRPKLNKYKTFLRCLEDIMLTSYERLIKVVCPQGI